MRYNGSRRHIFAANNSNGVDSPRSLTVQFVGENDAAGATIDYATTTASTLTLIGDDGSTVEGAFLTTDAASDTLVELLALINALPNWAATVGDAHKSDSVNGNLLTSTAKGLAEGLYTSFGVSINRDQTKAISGTDRGFMVLLDPSNDRTVQFDDAGELLNRRTKPIGTPLPNGLLLPRFHCELAEISIADAVWTIGGKWILTVSQVDFAGDIEKVMFLEEVPGSSPIDARISFSEPLRSNPGTSLLIEVKNTGGLLTAGTFSVNASFHRK